MRVLCIHGVNTNEDACDWKSAWSEVVVRRLTSFRPKLGIEPPEFVAYNDLFEQTKLGFFEELEGFAKLGWSGLVHGVGDALHRERGLTDLAHGTRWTAGMVLRWAVKDALRAQTRRLFAAKIRAYAPDVILAHSLGTLVLYDTLRTDPSLAAGRTVVTFGSQIGNPFVRQTLGGTIRSFGQKFWWHLFNPEDKVLTARLDVTDGPFEQVETEFDAGPLDHDAVRYLDHDLTAAQVWQPLALGSPAVRGVVRALQARRAASPRHRALLVGINEYPDPSMRLEGCVNDTYLMSAALQDAGFPASGIRVLLDGRAKTAAIRERLDWLLADTRPGDQRVLFYSGHGAQMPNYGPADEVDRVDECLVPWDFDWSVEHAILDDTFRDLYAQLPYDASFTAVLDCCHSGGMTRGGVRVRGVDPPADIRHRALQWNGAERGWGPRELKPWVAQRTRAAARAEYVGRDGVTRRLGRAVALRTADDARYDRIRKQYGHYGPYLPVLLEACREGESAYEYRDGSTPYGAFTFHLVQALRAGGGRRTFRTLVREAARGIAAQGYEQHPQLVGPDVRLRRPVPWRGAASATLIRERRARAGPARPGRHSSSASCGCLSANAAPSCTSSQRLRSSPPP
ncbi:MAG: caspase family protein [Candidatus Eisenbacteria bacterium]